MLRPEAVLALKGSELIIHAGDVGSPEILDQLCAIAPVTAVRGNIDTEPWACELPETTVVEAGNASIYVLHNVHDLEFDPVARGYGIVISGHSHKYGKSERGGVLYVNPGSAGPRRFRLPVTLARLDVTRQPWRVEFVDLLKTTAP